MIPAHPYFLPKPGEHNVTLTLFTADPSRPRKIVSASVCKIGDGKGMRNLVAIAHSVFESSKEGISLTELS